MALIVETGSGSATAESYISEADADTYHDNHSASTLWSTATTAVKEDALRVATQYLDAKYSLRWLGTRSNLTQRLAWPRTGITDQDGFSIEATTMPRQLTEACAEAALLHITESGGLLPSVSSPGIKKERDKVGPLETEVEYASTKTEIPTFTLVDMLIKALVLPSGRVVRA